MKHCLLTEKEREIFAMAAALSDPPERCDHKISDGRWCALPKGHSAEHVSIFDMPCVDGMQCISIKARTRCDNSYWDAAKHPACYWQERRLK